MATLASRVDSAMQEVKNCHGTSKAREPSRSETNSMWKLHNDADNDLRRFKENKKK